MSSKFVVEHLDGITTIRLLQRMDVEQFIEMIGEIAKQDVGDRRLWNVTRNFNYSSEDIRHIAARVRAIFPDAERVAFVAADDLTFGQVRMFEAFRDSKDFPTKAFRDEPAARAWLQG